MQEKKGVNKVYILLGIFAFFQSVVARFLFIPNRYNTRNEGHAKTRKFSDVKYCVWHHTKTNRKFSVPEYDQIAQDRQGVKFSPYHILIRKWSIVSLNLPKFITPQTSDFNSVSIGIALEGDFEVEKPTPFQVFFVYVFWFILRVFYNIKSTYHQKQKPSTLCPGKNFIKILKPIT